MSDPSRPGSRKSLLVRLLACLLIFCHGCGNTEKKRAAMAHRDPDTVRYRLLLRENAVDPGEAFRCFGGCQSQTTPDGYVQCLTGCPDFQVDHGFFCGDHEVPPIAACITARKVRQDDELAPGWVVLSVVAGVAVVVALSSVCGASASSQCGYPLPLY